MALLVASLLLAALAPVMTKKFGEMISIEGTMPGGRLKTHELTTGDCDTTNPENNTCRGTFDVPVGFNGYMTVTAVGGGGGGGGAATSGSVEYKSAGTYNFKVPEGVTELEVTLVSGGAGGGAGGQIVTNKDFTDDGKTSWTPADVTVGKYVVVTGCGGGGGSGGSRNTAVVQRGGGGGSGAYGSMALQVANKNQWEIHIGGGGGGGSTYSTQDGFDGGYYAGGGGGGGNNGTGALGWGLGGKAGTSLGGAGGLAAQGWSMTFAQRCGESAIPSGGGAGGAPTTVEGDLRAALGAGGGDGGSLAGGGGGGGVEGTGAGGGGGGPTRLFINGVLKGFWPGGGGGGAPSVCNSTTGESYCYLGGAGGGGGGNGGGAGGDAVDTYWKLGNKAGKPGKGGSLAPFTIRGDGSAHKGGVVTSAVFPAANNCSGGTAPSDYGFGESGKDGALRISYLNYGTGGSGGGGGAIVPKQRLKVIPGETLTVVVGAGGLGLKAGSMSSGGTENKPASWQIANIGGATYIERGQSGSGKVLLRTHSGAMHSSGSGCSTGIIGDDPNTPYFYCASRGSIHDGIYDPYTAVSVSGFSSTHGRTAGNGTTAGYAVYNNGTIGGDGGTTTLFGLTSHCSAGKGGTLSSPKGKDAAGYGGCGGGGGYGLADGGNGADGYVKIVWNPDGVGSGSGGSSGNLLVQNVSVKSGEAIEFQIGTGGAGGSISGNNTEASNADGTAFLNGEYGGDTIFAVNFSDRKVEAGGGYGGLSPVQTGTGVNAVVVSGGAPLLPSICKFKGVSSASLTCTAFQGQAATPSRGGTGGNSPYTKAGGGSSVLGNSGRPGGAVGAGGGGASVQSGLLNPLTNTLTGGNGAAGVIYLQWTE